MTGCPLGFEISHLRNVLIRMPTLTAVQRCLALDGIKRGICPCSAICTRGADQIVEAARRAGEPIPRAADLAG